MNLKVLTIETVMAERGMTQAMLAKSSGISKQSICTILRRGTCVPRNAGKLAAGLGVPVVEIVEGR